MRCRYGSGIMPPQPKTNASIFIIAHFTAKHKLLQQEKMAKLPRPLCFFPFIAILETEKSKPHVSSCAAHLKTKIQSQVHSRK